MSDPKLRCFSCGHEAEHSEAHRDHDKNHFVSALMGNQEYLDQIAKDQAEQAKENH